MFKIPSFDCKLQILFYTSLYFSSKLPCYDCKTRLV